LDRRILVIFGIIVAAGIGIYLLAKKAAEAEEEEEEEEPEEPEPEPPEPEPPDENPPGFEIDKVAISPLVAILGNPVEIKVYWFCPAEGCPDAPVRRERTFGIICTVNGLILQKAWKTDMGNGSVVLTYTPQSIGTYTATVQTGPQPYKSCTFEVKEETVGVFYSPFGSYTTYATLSALAEHIASLKKGSTSSTSRPWKTIEISWAGRHYTHGVVCPYCDKVFVAEPNVLERGSTFAAKTAAAYKLLEHIQSFHPDNPLTKPQCHIEINIPEPPVTYIDINTFDASTYFASIDGKGWRVLGWESQDLSARYVETTTFVSTLDKHHITIRGPVLCRALGFRPYRAITETTPTVFDQDITLVNPGDKAVFNIQSRTVEIVEWKW